MARRLWTPAVSRPGATVWNRSLVLFLSLVLLLVAHGAALVFRVQPAVSLWFPPSGVAIALTFWLGPVGVGLTWIASFLIAPLWGNDGWSRFASVTDGLEPLVAWWLYRRCLKGSLTLKSLRDGIAFILSAPIAACATSAIVGSLALAAFGKLSLANLPQSIPSWWLGNAIGTMAIAPTALIGLTPFLQSWLHPSIPEDDVDRDPGLDSWRSWIELAILLFSAAAIALLTVEATTRSVSLFQQLVLFGFIPILWAAIRFGKKGGVLVVSGAVLAALMGYLLLYPNAITLPRFPVDPEILYTHKLSLLLQGAIALLAGTAITERESMQVALAEERVRLTEYQARAQLSEKLLQLNHRLAETSQRVLDSEQRFRTSVENMLDCFGIYSAVRNELGQIVDFRTEYVNEAACTNNQLTREEQMGRGRCEILPNHRSSGLFDEYCQVVETGQPLVKDSLIYEDEYGQHRLVRGFDIRIAKYGDGFVATWRDVTDRRVAEEELRRRQQEFQALAENSPDVISRLDRHFRHVYVNPAIEQAIGLKPEAVIGKTPAELGASEAHVHQWTAKLQAVFQTGQAQADEFVFPNPDGSDRFYQARLVPEFAPDHSVASVLVVSHDITALKYTEEALRRSEARLRRIVESNIIGIFFGDLSGKITDANEAFLQMIGYTRSDLEAGLLRWDAITPPEYMDDSQQAVEELRQIGTFTPFEKEFFRKDGSRVWVELGGTLLDDPEQGLCYVIDLSDRKLAEAQTQQLASIAQNSTDFIGIATLDEKPLFLNPAGQQLVGLTQAQVRQMPSFLECFAQEDQAFVRQTILPTVLEQGSWQGEFRFKHFVTGELIPVFYNVFVTRDAKTGQPIAFATVTRDIRNQKRIEAERAELLTREQAARQQAEAASRMKDEFLAIVSHELRSPLNAILGWSRLLHSRKMDETTTERALEAIERNAQAQTQLIEDLLDISRIIRGAIRLHFRSLQLSRVVEAAIDTVRPAATTKKIHLEAHLDNSLSVSGDFDRLQQVVWNLLSNAVKFTPTEGQVTIWLEKISPDSEATPTAQIRVTDSGKGIDPEFLPYVFDRFRQADGTSSRTQGGLGLGLSIVRNLVELHGGTVHADSLGEGQGAIFTVRLPLAESSLSSTAKTDDLTPAVFRSLEGLKVLIVDDDTDTREFLSTALSQQGISVIPAASAQEALQLLQQLKPDVLLSDIGMPIEDGYALIRQVRSLPPEAGGTIPAAALTAYVRDNDRRQAIAAGFQLHVPKPIDPVQLLNVVAQLATRVPD